MIAGAVGAHHYQHRIPLFGNLVDNLFGKAVDGQSVERRGWY